MTALREGTVPKGDVLAVARIAGIAAAKKTPDLLPLAHTIGVHGAAVDLELAEDRVRHHRHRAHRGPHRGGDGGPRPPSRSPRSPSSTWSRVSTAPRRSPGSRSSRSPAAAPATGAARAEGRAAAAFDAVVLAGGTARRLGGVSKPDVELAGRRLLDHALAATAGARRVVVVAPASVAVPDGVTRTLEDPPHGGPVAGLAAGLAALDALATAGRRFRASGGSAPRRCSSCSPATCPSRPAPSPGCSPASGAGGRRVPARRLGAPAVAGRRSTAPPRCAPGSTPSARGCAGPRSAP